MKRLVITFIAILACLPAFAQENWEDLISVMAPAEKPDPGSLIDTMYPAKLSITEELKTGQPDEITAGVSFISWKKVDISDADRVITCVAEGDCKIEIRKFTMGKEGLERLGSLNIVGTSGPFMLLLKLHNLEATLASAPRTFYLIVLTNMETGKEYSLSIGLGDLDNKPRGLEEVVWAEEE
jgi:hypothetical protein